MSHHHQDRNYQSGHYQTSYPYPPQQHGQFPQPQPNTHNDRTPSHHAYPSYPEGSLQHPPSGQGYGGRSPSMGTMSFPESQHSSASPLQSYFPSSQITPNPSVATHQQERRGSHGHFPATGPSSDSQRLYAAGAGSDTGGGSNIYSAQPQPHHGGGYTVTAAQPQDWNAAVYEGAQGHGPRSMAPGVPPVGSHRQLHRTSENPAIFDEGHDSRTKAPPYQPASASKSLCRYPRCGHHVFFDRRVNELREWCGDQHMQAAITHRVEKPCNTCRVWPRRNGYKHCSGNVCHYPRYSGY